MFVGDQQGHGALHIVIGADRGHGGGLHIHPRAAQLPPLLLLAEGLAVGGVGGHGGKGVHRKAGGFQALAQALPALGGHLDEARLLPVVEGRALLAPEFLRQQYVPHPQLGGKAAAQAHQKELSHPQGVEGLHGAGGLGRAVSPVEEAGVGGTFHLVHRGVGDEPGELVQRQGGGEALLQQGQALSQAEHHRLPGQGGQGLARVLALGVFFRVDHRGGMVLRGKPAHGIAPFLFGIRVTPAPPCPGGGVQCPPSPGRGR